MSPSATAAKRADQLFQLGLKFNGVDYALDDINVHWVEIACDSDEEFEGKVADIRAELARRQEVTHG